MNTDLSRIKARLTQDSYSALLRELEKLEADANRLAETINGQTITPANIEPFTHAFRHIFATGFAHGLNAEQNNDTN